MFGDQPNLSLAKAHIQIKRCRQSCGHAVTEFIEQHKGQNKAGLLHTLAGEKLFKGINNGLIQRGGMAGICLRLGNTQGHQNTDKHKGCGNHKHALPGQAIGQNQGQGTWDQSGNSVGVNVN